MFACLAVARQPEGHGEALVALARELSPRVAPRGRARVVLDVDGLGRRIGGPRDIGEQLRRAAADRGWVVRVAVAPTYTAAELAALARAGLTVIPQGEVAARLAPFPLAVLAALLEDADPVRLGPRGVADVLRTLERWGLRTLGALAALPRPDLFERLGVAGLQLQRLARGEDLGPLVPSVDEEPFESALTLDWPLHRRDALAFVLERLIEPLCARLDRAGAGAVRLEWHVRLATRDERRRTLEFPVPIRDPRLLRTLVLLDVEAHLGPAAVSPRVCGHGGAGAPPRRIGDAEEWGIDAVRVRIEPAPARVVQTSWLGRAWPGPEQRATLLARLAALVGEDRVGAPALVESHRPGAFGMTRFDPEGGQSARAPAGARPADSRLVAGLRRCRTPIPARVVLEQGRPIEVRVGYPLSSGGRVVAGAGPWRTSGAWWATAPAASGAVRREEAPWDRDEWDLVVSDGGVYRVFRDRITDRWFVDGLVD